MLDCSSKKDNENDTDNIMVIVIGTQTSRNEKATTAKVAIEQSSVD